MKRFFYLVLLVIFLSGCAYGKEKMERLLIDQDYVKYKKLEDDLEQEYLSGYLTYGEYVQKKDALNQERIQTEKSRHDIVTGQ